MLFIFRKIRRSFFLPGKARTYLAYALGEIVLIVIGIFIAFSLNTWWDDRSERVAEELLLEDLHAELVSNLAALDNSDGVARASFEATEVLLAMTGPDASAEPRKVDSLLNATLSIATFDPSTGTLEQILRLDGIRLIKCEPLRRELARWDEQLRDYREDETRAIDDTIRDLLPLVRGRLPVLGLQEHAAWASSGSAADRQALVRDLNFANVLGEKRFRLKQLLTEAEDLRDLMELIVDLIDAELAERGMSETN